MVQWVIGSIPYGGPIELFLPASASITKAVVTGMCYPFCGTVHIKEPLLLIRKSSPYSGNSRFPLCLNGPLQHITVNKMC